MDESDDFCHSSPKCAKLIHATGTGSMVIPASVRSAGEFDC
jgi:hypothetical protein